LKEFFSYSACYVRKTGNSRERNPFFENLSCFFIFQFSEKIVKNPLIKLAFLVARQKSKNILIQGIVDYRTYSAIRLINAIVAREVIKQRGGAN
jgi:hypothetical protein